MFPIKDHNPSLTTPFVTYGLIIVNVLVFLSYWPLSESDAALASFYGHWAMIPARVSAGEDWHTLLTSMFLHGGWMHLAGNMLFLWIFGDNLEDQMGHVGFLIFYLVCGVGADVAQLAADPASPIPTVGASGAIAGVMGAYLLLFPKARVDVILFFVIFFKIFPVPAWVMLGIWFALQLVSGAVTDTAGGGVAYWAHAGGFAIGFLYVLPLWLKRGGTSFWRTTHGHPPHPDAAYKIMHSRIPKVQRK